MSHIYILFYVYIFALFFAIGYDQRKAINEREYRRKGGAGVAAAGR